MADAGHMSIHFLIFHINTVIPMRAWNYKTIHRYFFFDKVGVDIQYYTPPIQIHFGFQSTCLEHILLSKLCKSCGSFFFTDYSLESVPQSYKYYLLELETDHVSQSVFEMCAARHIVLK